MLATRMRMGGGNKTFVLYKDGVFGQALVATDHYVAYPTYFSLSARETVSGDNDYSGYVIWHNINFTGYKKLIIKSSGTGTFSVDIGNTGTTTHTPIGSSSSTVAEFNVSTLGGQLRGLSVRVNTGSSGTTYTRYFTEIILSPQ